MSVDKDLFRALAGSFASGVTIVTSGGDGHFHAMTASAFSSLSLDPPMVLVCVDKRAESLAIISRHGGFNINVLNRSQEPLSNACARRGTPESSLEGVSTRMGELGIPLIEGCLAYFECRVVHEFDAGDHIIFAGRVEAGSIGEAAEPLLYFRSNYAGLDAAPLAERAPSGT